MVLLSTQYQVQEINEAHPERKPENIMNYHRTRGGVDLADQLIAEYCHCSTRRWPMTIFFHAINVAVANSGTLYCQKHPLLLHHDRSKRATFLHTIACDLMWPQILRRSGQANPLFAG